ncbi:dynein heavy chain domain-containing protein 1-like [Heptranchias perlo]|uniref:dynein heavy chain domain-containing protein 1-like n=1 Tax=Heptranchias perlo TaxID=212740 RepID=UPI0035594F75
MEPGEGSPTQLGDGEEALEEAETERLRWHAEDSLMTLSMIVSTSAPGNIQEEAEKFMEKIQQFGELLDLWKIFQDKWVFLHKVFFEMELKARKPDPKLMLRIEGVDELYRRVIQTLSTNPSVLTVILSQHTKLYQGMTLPVIFTSGIAAMEEIILQMYHLLESARQEFVRLYFLSDDDVLRLLTLQPDPHRLLPFVKKCFKGVKDLHLETVSDADLGLLSPRVSVLAIYGDLQERVNLIAPLEPGLGAIPWLRSLEQKIQQSLFRSLETCVAERTALAGEINSTIKASSSTRSEVHQAAQLMTYISKLASSFPSQCILIAEEVCWQMEAEKVLFGRTATNKESFKVLCSTKINRLVLNVREYCKRSPSGPEDSRTLSLLKCLIVMSINHRDIGNKLMATNIESKASFEWQELIKYKFDLNWIFSKRENLQLSSGPFGPSVTATDHSHFGLRCYVDILGTNYYYDYEYIGPRHWFVHTPLTERICLALVLALQNFNPCALVGPSGAGRAATLSHLARVLGYQLVTLSCYKEMDLWFLSRALCGAVQSGAWLVLENTDSLTLGMLSILGQHLTTIQNSYRKLIGSDNPNTADKDQSTHPFRKGLGGSLTDVMGSKGSPVSSGRTWSAEDMRQDDPTSLGSIRFEGNVIPARVNYGTFMTLRTFDSSATIPENLRMVLRPVAVIRPDLTVITEVKLLSVGFLKASHFVGKILSFFKVAKDSGSISAHCYLPMMDRMIHTAAKVLYQTLRPKNPEKSSNLGSEGPLSNPIQSPPEQVQHGQKGDGGDGGIDGGGGKSVYVEHCLLSSFQLIDNPSSADTVSEAPKSSRNISAPIFESVLLVEEYSVLKALSITLFPAVSDPEKLHNLKDLLKDLFPGACRTVYEPESDPSLLSAIKQELLDTEHQVTQEMVNRILELYQALKVSKGVLMLGPSGSGKTTSYKTLSRALNQLARNEPKETEQADAAGYDQDSVAESGPVHRAVHVSIAFPNSHSLEELLGGKDSQTWRDGILAKWLNDAENWHQASAPVKDSSSIRVETIRCPEPLRWIVLDGELCLDWMEPISSLLSHGHYLTLANGERRSLADSTSLILEVSDLSNAPPSAVTWCNLVCYQGNDTWKAVLDHMMDKIYSNYAVPRETVEVWSRISWDLVPNTLEFLQHHCVPALTHQTHYLTAKHNRVTYGVEEVMSFRRILIALLDKYVSRDQQQIQAQQRVVPRGLDGSSSRSQHRKSRLDDSILPKDHMLIRNILAVAYIWGFGGHLHSSYWPQFDHFARQALGSSNYNLHIPPGALVYDYHINPDTGCLETLDGGNGPEKNKGKAAAYVLLPQLEKYVQLLELLLLSGQSVLLVGESLSGKTSFVQAVKRLIACPTMLRLPISPNTRPRQIRSHVMERVFPTGQQQRAQPHTVRPGSKTNLLFFLDDLHTAPFKPSSGCQPVIEAFRHSVTCHGTYDTNCHQFRYFHSACVNYIITCAPCRGTRSFISSRFTRLFTVLGLPAMTKDMLMAIYTPSVLGWLNNFPTYTLTRHALLAKALVCATVELYQQVRDKLKPSPSHAHYLFSVVDVGKVLNGLLLMHPSSVTNLKKPSQRRPHVSESQISSSVLIVTKTVVDLWLHESMRTFYDCLLTEEDRETLGQTLMAVAQTNFCARNVENAESAELLRRIDKPSITLTVASQSSRLEYHQDSFPLPLESQSASGRGKPAHGEGGAADDVIGPEPQSQLSKTLQKEEWGSEGGNWAAGNLATVEMESVFSDLTLLGSEDQTTSTSVVDSGGPGVSEVTVWPSPPKERGGSRQKAGKVRRRHLKSGGRGRRHKRSEMTRPLVPLHLMRTGESLSDLIYSKGAVRPSTKQQMNSPRWNPYREVSSETLAQQLRQIVQKQNRVNKTNHEIIFFKEAVCHFARLYRALCTPRSHCALLGLTHCTGRKTLVRLAAHLTMSTVFEVSGQMSRAEMAEVVKRASYKAGVQGRCTVIVAYGALGQDTFHDLCDVMMEGKYPGLYSASELEQLAKAFATSRSMAWNLKEDVVLERFFSMVGQFLHLVLLLDYVGGRYPLGLRVGLPGHLARLLAHCSSVDVWEPWSQQALTQIAASHLGFGNLSTLNRTKGQSIAQIWMLLPVITKVMALIHQLALNYTQHMAPTLPLITPRQYIDFIDVFWMTSCYLVQSEGSQTERMLLGLDKVQEIYNTAEEYRRQIDLLKRKLELVAEKKQQLQDQFIKMKEEFMEILLKCREEEFRITMLLRELEAARKKFESEFAMVRPVYMAALHTLQSLSSSDLDEVRTYRAPPPPVVSVMNTLCMMFGKPDGWENVKQLISQPNFYQDLEFYDKENVPEHLFKALGELLQQPYFEPAVVRESSKAVESFSRWIHAVYHYATMTRQFSPSFVNDYQSRIEEAQTKLGLLRKQADRMKRALVALLREDGEEYLSDSDSATDLSNTDLLRLVEQKEQDSIAKLKEEEAMHLAELAHQQKLLEIAEELIQALNPHQIDWDKALKQSKDRSFTVSGDGLLTAAAVVYLGPLEEKMRQELLEKWKMSCHSGEIQMEPEDPRQELVKLLEQKSWPAAQEKVPLDTDHQRLPTFIPIRSDFLLLDILSSLGEQLDWNRAKLPVNATARVSALLTRILVKCCPLPWPLFVNPDHQLEIWVRVIQDGGGPQLHQEVLGVSGEDSLPNEEELIGDVALEAGTDETLGDILSGISHEEDGEIDWVPESITEKPPNNLWVCCITVENLDHTLLTAATNGIAVLVTHIERKPLTPVLKKLLRVQAHCGNLGPWVLTFGKQRIEVVPTFRLFLGTSLPLRIIEAEMDPTFLKQVRVIDLTISQSGLQELFLKEVLHFEKHRFEDIKLTVQMDTMYLQYQLQVTEEELMDKVIQTATSLLNDKSIQPAALDSLKAKEDLRYNIHACCPNEQRLGSLNDDPYVIISQIGSAMYWALVHISRLNPLYYFSKTSFLRVVREALSSRGQSDRPSGTGSSKDHFMELMNYIISKIYTYFRWCLFVKHARLYRFLVAVGHMKAMHTVTMLEWELFLRGTRDLRLNPAVRTSCILRPSWVSEEVWESCAMLELLPAFQNLRSSLANQGSQWREYFGLPSTVIGLAPCSKYSHLTTFQKAVLWRLFQPNKLSVIMNDVVTCELGGTLIRDLRLNLSSIFSYSRQNVPVMFLMPEAGSVSLSTHPLYWIQQLAKDQKMQDNVRIISLGSRDQSEEILRCLKKGMSDGHWLVLNNCHLSEHWDSRLVSQLIQLITAFKGNVPSQRAAHTVPVEYSHCDDRPVEDVLTILTEYGDKIHRDFRLWLICKNEASGSLPGILRRNTRKLVIETPSMLQNTLKRTYAQATAEHGDTLSPESLATLTALHAILLHRQHYTSWVQARSYHWTQADLFAALCTQKKLQTMCGHSDNLLELLVGLAAYRGHLLDRGDEEALISIIGHCLRRSACFSTRGICSLITSLTSTTGSALVNLTQQDVKKRIDLMSNSVEPVTVGLCNGVREQLIRRSHEVMSEILIKSQTLLIPRRPDSSRDEGLKAVLSDCIEKLQQLWDSMTMPGESVPETWVSAEPVRGFLLQEKDSLKRLSDQLLSDLRHTLAVLQGDRLRNTESDDIIVSLERGHLPRAWGALTRVSPPLPQGVQVLKMRLQLLNVYLDSPETPVSYNLAAFQRPRMLLVALLQERARYEQLDLNRYDIRAQVLTSSLPPTSPPVNGIYITGLQLHNALWDTRHGILQETLSTKPCSMPAVWLRAEEGDAGSAHLLYPQYQCPVYQGVENMEVDLKDSNIITHLPLMSKMDPSVCAQRRVHIASVI